ncbi:MAG TPA: XrtA/PEP-CTERM system TPR-repeat protein PrsT [Methyloversatilis sp.]
MVRTSGSLPGTTARLLCVMLALAFGASGCDRLSSSPEQMLDAARSALKSKDTNTALIQLKNALQKNPDFPDARFELGKIYFETGDMPSAVKELKKAQDLGVPESAVAPMLVRAMVEAGEQAQALSRFGATKLNDPAAQAELKAALGYAAMQTRNPDGARTNFDAALALKPDAVYALVGKARLLASQDDIEGGKALLKQVMDAGNGGPEAWFLDADINAAQGRVDAAMASYRKVYELKPDHLRARYAVVVGNANLGRLEDARKELAAFHKVAPKAPEGNYLDALVLVKEKKFVEARERINKMLALYPGHLPSLALSAQIEFELKSYAQAEQVAEKVIANGGETRTVRKILIASYLRNGRASKAQQALVPLLKEHPNDPSVLSLAGQVHMSAGDNAAASKAFELAAAKAPNDPVMHSRLGLSRLAQGDKTGGISELETATRLDSDDTTADMLLIATQLRSGNARGALDAIAGMEKKRPNDPVTHNLRGAALLVAKDLPGARKSFERALEIQPDYFPAAASLARLDLSEKHLQDAEGRYEKILGKSPGHPDALMALAGLKVSERKDVAAAAKLLEKAIDANPKLPAPRILLGRLYLAANQFDKAVKVSGDAAVVFPDDANVLETLALAQSAKGSHDDAATTLSRIVARDPQNVLPLMQLANVQLAGGHESDALQSVHKALGLRPDLMDAYVLAIRIYLKQDNVEEALRVARDMQKRQPKQPHGYAKEGEILLGANKPQMAIKPLRDAYARAHDSNHAILLYAALVRAGNAKDATALADEWLKSSPQDPKFRMFLGDLAMKNQQYDEARRYYDQLYALLPENPVILNNLAWLAHRRSDPKAREYAEKAYKLGPTAPAVLDTYGEILVDSGEAERGIKMLQDAVASSPKVYEFRFTLARALIKVGKKAEARKELETLSALGDRYGRSGEAASLLKTL